MRRQGLAEGGAGLHLFEDFTLHRLEGGIGFVLQTEGESIHQRNAGAKLQAGLEEEFDQDPP